MRVHQYIGTIFEHLYFICSFFVGPVGRPRVGFVFRGYAPVWRGAVHCGPGVVLTRFDESRSTSFAFHVEPGGLIDRMAQLYRNLELPRPGLLLTRLVDVHQFYLRLGLVPEL